MEKEAFELFEQAEKKSAGKSLGFLSSIFGYLKIKKIYVLDQVVVIHLNVLLIFILKLEINLKLQNCGIVCCKSIIMRLRCWRIISKSRKY